MGILHREDVSGSKSATPFPEGGPIRDAYHSETSSRQSSVRDASGIGGNLRGQLGD